MRSAFCLLDRPVFRPLVLWLLLPVPALASWTTAETDTISGTPSSELSPRFSIAVDALDRPHAVWTSDGLGFYSRKEGEEWIAPVEIGNDDAVYQVYAIDVVPGTTHPAVLYSRRSIGEPAGDLWLALDSGGGFVHTSLTDDDLAEYLPALAMDPSGAYHVVCSTEIENVWRLRYLTDVSGEPSETLIDAGSLGSFGSGAGPSLAVEPAGLNGEAIVHVVYRGVVGGYRIQHVANDAPGSTTWTWETLVSPNAEDLIGDVAWAPAGDGRNAGVLHAAVSGYDCFLCTRHTYVFTRTGDDPWQLTGTIAHAQGLGGPSIALDGTGSPHVVMTEISGNVFTGRIYHASALDGWTPTLVVGDDHMEPDVAIGSDGVGHVVCTTGPNTGVHDVLHLASQPHVVGVEETSPAPVGGVLAARPNPFGRVVVIDRVSAAGRVSVYDVAGRLVRTLRPLGIAAGAGGRDTTVRWDGRDLAGRRAAPGVYVVVDARGVSTRVVHVH